MFFPTEPDKLTSTEAVPELVANVAIKISDFNLTPDSGLNLGTT